MRTFTRHKRAALAIMTSVAAIGNVAASPVSWVQELDFKLFRVDNLETVGSAGAPWHSAVADADPPIGFLSFQSSYGTLKSAHWEIDMDYSVRVHSVLTSLSTNPAEQVESGVVYGYMNVGTTQLAGTGGQQFLAVAETNGTCTTSLAQGACDWVDETKLSMQASIDVIDLNPFLAGNTIVQQVMMGAELWHFGGQGAYRLESFGEFGAFGPAFSNAKLRLVFDYDNGEPSNNVPEPGSLALVGLGLAAVLKRVGALSRTRP